jgi:hypothetical protein
MTSEMGSRLRHKGRGLDHSEVYALIRDVLMYRLSRQEVTLLQSDLKTLATRFDERRDELLGDPDEFMPEEVRAWLQGVKTKDNPTGDGKKTHAIKWLRTYVQDTLGHALGLREAKDYVEGYIEGVRQGKHLAMPLDMRPRWMLDDAIPEDLLTPSEKRAINSALPPWDQMPHVTNHRADAIESIGKTLGYTLPQARELVEAYEERFKSKQLTCKVLLPDDAILGNEGYVEMDFDEFLDED